MGDSLVQHGDRRALIVELGEDPGDGRIEPIRSALAADAEIGQTIVYLACPKSSRSRFRESASSFEQVHGVIDSGGSSSLTGILTSLNAANSIRAVAFLPASATFGCPEWTGIPLNEPALRIWLPRLDLPMFTDSEHQLGPLGWIASMPLIDLMLTHGIGFAFNASEVACSLLAGPVDPLWISSSAGPTQSTPPANEPILRRHSTVLAIVPHYRCEQWLHRCLHSLTSQIRPPDAIVVIDDASANPPRDLVARYPEVTLLQATGNVGPYNLVQKVIDSTQYDAYLFQDADDWSTWDRLDLLLEAAEHTGAELIGTQEFRFHAQTGGVNPVCYPIDVNRALSDDSWQALLHPSSLAGRALIRRIGGFATGLRFGGDTEFLLRAGYAGRITNIPRFCYFRRIRSFSLTTAPETGSGSPVRRSLQDDLSRQYEANRTCVAQGRAPSLVPVTRAELAVVNHVCGPKLRA